MDNTLEWLKDAIDKQTEVVQAIRDKQTETVLTIREQTVEIRQMKELQAKQNGNVAKMQEEMNARKMWEMAQEAKQEAQTKRLDEMDARTKVSNDTAIRITKYTCATALLIAVAVFAPKAPEILKAAIGLLG